jgi:hypothetical protein
MHLVMRPGCELPAEDGHSTNANRVIKILIRAGAVAIERIRKAMNTKLSHIKNLP